MLAVSAPEAQLASAVQAAWSEVRKEQAYGFTKRELSAVRSIFRAELQTTWLERDQVESSSLCDEYKEHFLKGDGAPSVKWDCAALTSMLPTITLKELKMALNERLPHAMQIDFVVFVFQPQVVETRVANPKSTSERGSSPPRCDGFTLNQSMGC